MIMIINKSWKISESIVALSWNYWTVMRRHKPIYTQVSCHIASPFTTYLAALKATETSNYTPFSLSSLPFPELKRKKASFVIVLLYRNKW